MAQASITLDLSARTGMWCDTCRLSTAIEIDVLRIKGDGVSLVSTITRCANGPHDAGGR